jgi:methyl-accepting chemotaxis protein
MNKLFEKFIPMSDAFQKALLDYLNFQKEEVDHLSKEVDAIAASSRILITTLIVLFLLIGSFCAWYLTIGITRPLNSAVVLARRVADGDLTSDIRIDSSDETGQLVMALKDMNEGLRKIVAEVRDSTDTIVTASTEIASGNMDLSSRTESQAGSLEETASSMEELTSTMQQNSQNAHDANQLVHAAADAAIQGGRLFRKWLARWAISAHHRKKLSILLRSLMALLFKRISLHSMRLWRLRGRVSKGVDLL